MIPQGKTIKVGDKLVSIDILKEEFVCNIENCQGACCVKGYSGAPLEYEELNVLEEIYPKIKDSLSPGGKDTIEKKNGKPWEKDSDGDYTTVCVNKKEECAFTIFENNKALCAIEKAHKHGLTEFKKPVSCHLYPIRVEKHFGFEILNYDRWDICSPACVLGKKLKIPVYKFLKEPLIRAYGIDWYQELEDSCKHI